MKPIVALFVLLLSLAGPSQAQDLSGVAQLEILPGWRGADGQHVAGFRIRLADGWKTYWRAPGDAGIPPSFDWEGSKNVSNITASWPVPEIFRQSGARSIGYKHTVVIPLTIDIEDEGAPVQLKGRFRIGVCEEICVPAEFEFDVTLAPTSGRDPAIIAALIDQPKTAQEAGVESVVCVAQPLDDGIRVTATIRMPQLGAGEAVIIEAGNPEVWISEPVISRNANQLVASADLIHVAGEPFFLDRSAIRITVLAEGRATDIRGCPAG